jgi:hypothetical protein
MKTSITLLAFFFLPLAALAQENERTLEGPGRHSKYLTPGQLDEWIFDGEKGETIIAHVATREFDSVLGLAKKGEKENQVLFEVDDEGSDSRFSFRLPEDGQYRIRIHAFKYKGGGNYDLNVQRFHAKPVEVGKPLVGAFDRAGNDYHYFQGAKDRIVTVELKGAASSAWKILDPKGREISDWSGAVTIKDEGEHSLMVSGRPENRYDLVVRDARRQDLDAGKAASSQLKQGEMDVWSFHGKPGDFRLLEVEKKGELASRLIFAPLDKKEENRLAKAGERPAIQFLPAASLGGHLRYAVLLGRKGRYQLQLVAETPASYKLKAADPTVPIDRDHEVGGNLSLGGAAYYSFKASPGQLIHASLGSRKFVPLLGLYDSHGNLIKKNDDSTDDLESRITHMVVEEGLYRLRVSSLGDGGGGEFSLALRETKPKEVEVGGRGQGTLQPGRTDFWAFSGKEGKSVFLNVRSAVCAPVTSVRSPDGVELVSEDHGSFELGSLLAIKLPKTGRYTVRISSARGAGDYTVRLIDGD